MLLTKHQTATGPRWALDGLYLPTDFTLSSLLQLSNERMLQQLSDTAKSEQADSPLLAPIEVEQEVWASGVTYLSSRMAREAESQSKDVYQKVYAADRPELFFKANGWRVSGHQQTIRVRQDSSWDVPEPELALVINSAGTIVGYTVGNDVSSRSIEGENPLYLPQAKVYNSSCALGPGIRIRDVDTLRDVPIDLKIFRSDSLVFEGDTRTSQIKRTLEELAEYLYRELDQPHGCFLMTGTGVVPTESFSLMSGDIVRITIDGLELENTVA